MFSVRRALFLSPILDRLFVAQNQKWKTSCLLRKRLKEDWSPHILSFLLEANLEMVNLVLSSTIVFHYCTLKLYKGIIQQIDKYRKHCLWRGSDLNAKQTSKAAWIMVCLPKSEGRLGVLNLATHNDSLLLKFLYKFFTRANIPWFNLVWENYYHSGKLHGQQRKGFFWWRDLVKLIDSFKGLAKANAHNEDTILLRNDTWNYSRYNSSLERHLE